VTSKVKLRVSKEAVEEAKDRKDLEPPKPGIYVFQLREISPEFAKDENGEEDKSRPYLNCVWKPIAKGREQEELDAPLGNVWDIVSFSEDSEWKRAEFALALGLPMKNGEIDADIEIDPDKPKTVIGTKILGRVKAKKKRSPEDEYRPSMARMWPLVSEPTELGDDGNPFDAAAEAEPDSGVEYLTEEGLLEMDLKELGELAKTDFDLDPNEYVVRDSKKKVDLDATKAAVVAAILEAQGADGDAAEEDEESPF